MDPFLNNHPELQKRYEADLRRKSSCSSCAKASLKRKYQKLAIQAETAAALKAGLNRGRSPG